MSIQDSCFYCVCICMYVHAYTYDMMCIIKLKWLHLRDWSSFACYVHIIHVIIYMRINLDSNITIIIILYIYTLSLSLNAMRFNESKISSYCNNWIIIIIMMIIISILTDDNNNYNRQISYIFTQAHAWINNAKQVIRREETTKAKASMQ